MQQAGAAGSGPRRKTCQAQVDSGGEDESSSVRNCGAGDENRTRTISLGSGAVTAARGADLASLAAVRNDPD